MKKSLIILIVFNLGYHAFCQKKPLDFKPPESWPTMHNEQLSNDGKFFAYTISDGENFKRVKLIIQSTDKSWRTEVKGVGTYKFTDNSNSVIFENLKSDSLGVIELGSESIAYYPNIKSSWQLMNDDHNLVFTIRGDSLCVLELATRYLTYFPDTKAFKRTTNRHSQYLVFQKEKPDKSVIAYNLVTKKERVFRNIRNFYCSEQGNILLLQKALTEDSASTLEWVGPKNGSLQTIWKGAGKVSNIVFDQTETRLAYIVEDGTYGNKKNQLFFYKADMPGAKVYAGDGTPGMDNSFTLSTTQKPEFSPNGSQLFFGIAPKATGQQDKQKQLTDGVRVWNYLDETLRPTEISSAQSSNQRNYLAVLNEGTNRLIRLELDKGETVMYRAENMLINANYILILHTNNYTDTNRYLSNKKDIYLVSTVNGKRKILAESLFLFAAEIAFSPAGKYVTWFDLENKNYYAYNIELGTTLNVSKSVPNYLDDETDITLYHNYNPPFSYGIPKWGLNDSWFLVYDQFDIWRLDPRGKELPINITAGYGRTHQTELRFVQDMPNPNNGQHLLLSGFDTYSKYNGFFTEEINRLPHTPVLLNMSPVGIYMPGTSVVGTHFADHFLVKARDKNIWLLTCQSASEYPNLYSTNDFKSFNKLTDLKPQAAYNWMTSEVVHWKMFDGKISDGILYKPENFDSQKKYPIIFYFYETLSQNAFIFKSPGLSVGPMNIPYYVSNGNLVFCPDIHYKVNRAGEGIVNTIVSAAKFISKIPYVDSTKMGIQGHSWGGYEVDYLVAHTSLFAAAVGACGLSNMDMAFGRSRDGAFGQNRIDTDPWSDPEVYIKNSPYFYANNVMTPLLMMANPTDWHVNSLQSIRYFAALRKLGKPSWILQYDKEGHVLTEQKNELDYSIRMTQFFDHYLKGAPMPKWMSEPEPVSKLLTEDDYHRPIN